MSSTPLTAIRKKCLDCCAGSRKAVKYCPLNDCDLWPYRFGIRPSTVIKEFGQKFIDPDQMPDSQIQLEALP